MFVYLSNYGALQGMMREFTERFPGVILTREHSEADLVLDSSDDGYMPRPGQICIKILHSDKTRGVHGGPGVLLLEELRAIDNIARFVKGLLPAARSKSKFER